MNIEDLIKKEMIPKTVKHWGQPVHTHTPVLINATHGDGQCLISFTPLGTRPDYYIIRVDSSIKKMIEDDGDEIRDFLETGIIYDMIEDECGCMYIDDDPDADVFEEIQQPFPALDMTCGAGWGLVE